MSMPCSIVDGRSSELVLGVHVGPGLQQDVDRLGVSLASGVGERSRLRVLVGDVDARKASGSLDEQTQNSGVTFASSKMLRPVSSRIGEDLGATLEQKTCDVLVSRLAGEREGVEVLVGRCGRLKADSLVEEGLHNGAAAVGNGVDNGAVSVEVENGGIGRGRDEEAADLRVAVDGSVVKGVATVNVGLGDGDTLLKAYCDERETSSAGGLWEMQKDQLRLAHHNTKAEGEPHAGSCGR